MSVMPGFMAPCVPVRLGCVSWLPTHTMRACRDAAALREKQKVTRFSCFAHAMLFRGPLTSAIEERGGREGVGSQIALMGRRGCETDHVAHQLRNLLSFYLATMRRSPAFPNGFQAGRDRFVKYVDHMGPYVARTLAGLTSTGYRIVVYT